MVTNNHVIDGADADGITVKLQDDTEFKAKLLGKDAKTDIALLKIEPGNKKLVAVKFGDSGKMRVGDWVLAIGNPSASAARSPPASSRPGRATSIPAPMTTSSRPMRRSTRATPAARCSTWRARSSA